MTKLSIYGLAILLVLGTTGALAGNKHFGGKHYGGKHYGSKNYGTHHNQHKKWGTNHHQSWGKNWHHNYRSNFSQHYRHYYPRRHSVYSIYLGSALARSLYHTHHGVTCYDNHGYGGRHDQYAAQENSYTISRSRHSSNTEIVGCYRLEQLEDGEERRVELPLSECR